MAIIPAEILSKLELNEKNVMELLFKCHATPQTKNVIRSNFYEIDCSRKAPIIMLDQDIVFANNNLIRYWLGQLQFVHQQKEVVTPALGAINYQGQQWITDKRTLFALYYLATASNQLPGFGDSEGNKYPVMSKLWAYYETGLDPTYPPSDPRFDIKEAEYALNELGISIQE